MILNDNDIMVITAVVAPLLTMLSTWALMCYSVRWTMRNFKSYKDPKKDSDKLMYLYGAVFIALYYICMIVLMSGVFALIEGAVIAGATYIQKRSVDKEYERSAERYGIVREDRDKIIKIGYVNLLVINLYILLIFVLAVRFGTQWLLPEVTTVKIEDGRGSTVTDYELFTGKDLRLTDCYVDNCTPDTLYRMIVWYAWPAEGEENNVFTVTDTIAPGELMKVRGKVCYAMKRIPSFRDPVSTRMRKIHRKVSYVVDKNGYLRFKYSSAPAKYGLKSNRQVEPGSFSESNIMK